MDLPVSLSDIMTASRMSPYLSKCSLKASLGVSHAKPPTKTLVSVVSPNCPILLLLLLLLIAKTPNKTELWREK